MKIRTIIFTSVLMLLTAAILFYVVWAVTGLKKARTEAGMLGEVMTIPQGSIQYLSGGHGPAVLVIHGAGGGCDMGRLLAELAVPEGFTWVAPSRFGYLDSKLGEDVEFSYRIQAEAYHELMQSLGFSRYAVMSLSAGGGSGLQIAADYPDEVSCLIQLSASSHAAVSEEQSAANRKGNTLARLFSNDLLVWTAMKLFERQFMELCGIPKADAKNYPDEVFDFGRAFMDTMLPASMRTDGVLIDNRFPVPPELASRVGVPALIIHAENDGLQLYEQGRYAHEQIDGSEMLSFADGGHFAVIVHRDRINPVIKKFLDEYLYESYD